MNLLLKCSLLVPLVCATSTSRADEHLNASLELIGQASASRVGDPIRVRVLLLNDSDGQIELPPLLDVPGHWMRLELRDGRGELVEFVGPWRKMKLPKRTTWLAPHHMWGVVLDLTPLFDIRAAGEYRLECVLGEAPVGNAAPDSILGFHFGPVSTPPLRFVVAARGSK